MVRIDLDGYTVDEEVVVAVDTRTLQRQQRPTTVIRTEDYHIQEAFVDDDDVPYEAPTKSNMSLSVGTTITTSEQGRRLPSLRTDPFAIREGKTLTWTNVNMTLAASGKEPERKLLDGIWGEVPRNKTTAIMGPSGAGKTSLLNILAGRSSSKGKVSIGADVRLNNYAVDPTKIEVRQSIAFVAQDDSLQITQTPREAIRFSAKLRLPRSTTEDELDKLTERMIQELGLTACADTIVGGALIKGISGGERKRTSVGVELVVKPALVFLDEPTSGLDSFSAVQLCQVLRKVANAGASVLFTIHQPSSEIFSSFDHLILLNKGKVMYQGAVSDVPAYFAQRSQPCPPNYNPADWIMNVAQSIPINDLDRMGFFEKDSRSLGDAFTPTAGQSALGMSITRGSSDNISALSSATPGGAVQTAMLFTREIQSMRRNTMALGARFGLSAFLGTLIGIIFFQVGSKSPTDQQNLQSQFGATIMILMMTMFGTAQPALLAFPDERPVFLREYSTDHYAVSSYFIARLTMEAFVTALQVLFILSITFFLIQFQGSFVLFFIVMYTLAMASTAMAVFLGCAVEDPKLGQEMLFAGFFVAPSLIPPALRWARFLCSLTYAVRLIALSEFDNCLDPESEDFSVGCLNLLTSLSSSEAAADIDMDAKLDLVEGARNDQWWYWLALLVIFVSFRLLALFILQKKATKFF